MQGGMMGMINLGDIFGKGFGQKKEKRKLTVRESYDFLLNEESENSLIMTVLLKDLLTMLNKMG